ncbi:hypothetical protein Tco_0846664 [Tanacetum coccineum]
MTRSWPNDRKRKSIERDESWMKAPIMFPPLSMEDASDEPLIIEAVMEGYLVRRVYVDQGASAEVMFEHCFENLSPAIRSRLRGTQMDLMGFAGGVEKPLGKIELKVVFGDGDGLKIPLSGFIDNTLHGKVPHPKGDCDLGHSVRYHFRVSEVRKEANGRTGGQSEYQPRKRSPEKNGFDRTDIGQPCISGSSGNNRGKHVRTITRRTKKKGSGIRQNPSRKQGSGRMGERRNNSPDEITYMDIKPCAHEEKQWKLEDVHRLQKYQLGMPKRLLPSVGH